MERSHFYDHIRHHLFGGKLTESQVSGMEAILDEWENQKLIDHRWLAYMLATVFHETAKTMQPIAEYGKGRGRKYGKPDPLTGKTYYGRGFVQLTWKYNYQKMQEVTGKPLVMQPDLAMDLDTATQILFYGMTNGSFTGKKLLDYFNLDKEEWRNARRIINGLDKADLIAGYGKTFYEAIKLMI